MTEHTVVVSAGTYHLPFNRLVEWMTPWVAANPSVRVVMQHGPSRILPGAENHEILAYRKFLELCSAADGVVLQGGAGGVMDMREISRIPIVVPRVPHDGEVVDDHQLIFTERALELKAIWRATSQEQLWDYLDKVIAGELLTSAPPPEPTPGVFNISEALHCLPPRLGSGARLSRLFRMASRILLRR